MASRKSSTTASGRLTRANWINAAIEVMVDSSVEQVRVERLAVALGVSKGSFYWHFRTRDELLKAVLEQWADQATFGIQERLDQEASRADQRLLLYLQLPFRSPAAVRAADLEVAILGWARRSVQAMRAVARVDKERVKHITQIFLDMGFADDEALLRAHQTYACIRYLALRREFGMPERMVLARQFRDSLVRGAPRQRVKSAAR
ncbi:MAG: TetR/AcrR family transcriptional regulator [Proteobacteria bacterium]|nr:TetR/AcrR family transcriptional regulator [Pseudomonadota bacterium]